MSIAMVTLGAEVLPKKVLNTQVVNASAKQISVMIREAFRYGGEQPPTYFVKRALLAQKSDSFKQSGRLSAKGKTSLRAVLVAQGLTEKATIKQFFEKIKGTKFNLFSSWR